MAREKYDENRNIHANQSFLFHFYFPQQNCHFPSTHFIAVYYAEQWRNKLHCRWRCSCSCKQQIFVCHIYSILLRLLYNSIDVNSILFELSSQIIERTRTNTDAHNIKYTIFLYHRTTIAHFRKVDQPTHPFPNLFANFFYNANRLEIIAATKIHGTTI